MPGQKGSKKIKDYRIFSYAEKKMLQKMYGDKNIQNSQVAYKNFDQCYLCSRDVKDPVTCLKGHIFCRECILDNMVRQKKEIKENEEYYKKVEKQRQNEELLQKRDIEAKKKENFEKDFFD